MMKLIVSIDTEEDEWGCFKPTGHTVENIKNIPKLQSLFDEFNIMPTYLINYPVAIDDSARNILSEIEADGRCEIGAHCHPWNTPPFVESMSEKNSMLRNLDVGLQFDKLKALHETIQKGFNITPISFRSGRWGYNQDVADNISRLGYKVDSSIISYTSWSDYYGPDFSELPPDPFELNTCKYNGQRKLLEIPATVGYLRNNYNLSNRVYKLTRVPALKKLRLLGIIEKLNLVKQIVLSPELSTSEEMILLTDIMKRKGYKCATMYFHSTTLKVGASPYVKNKSDEDDFYLTIRKYLEYISSNEIDSIKLKDTVQLFKHTELNNFSNVPF